MRGVDRWRRCGISAAAEFLNKGMSVVMIEKNIVGGSSTGRSAGFLTPDSKLELHQLVRRYGVDAARDIWDAPCRGIDRIVKAIKKYDIQCGLTEQDSLFLGLGKSGIEAVASEKECSMTGISLTGDIFSFPAAWEKLSGNPFYSL